MSETLKLGTKMRTVEIAAGGNPANVPFREASRFEIDAADARCNETNPPPPWPKMQNGQHRPFKWIGDPALRATLVKSAVVRVRDVIDAIRLDADFAEMVAAELLSQVSAENAAIRAAREGRS